LAHRSSASLTDTKVHQPPSISLTLIRRFNAGEERALDELIERHVDWLRAHVSPQLGFPLRSVEDSGDIVQETARRALRYLPRIELADEGHLRRLLLRLVHNVLRDRYRWYCAQRRAFRQQDPEAHESLLILDGGPTPSNAASGKEEAARLRLAWELLCPRDRRVLFLRKFEGWTNQRIGESLGLSESGVRDLFARACRRLVQKVAAIRGRDIEGLLSQEPEEKDDSLIPEMDAGPSASQA